MTSDLDPARAFWADHIVWLIIIIVHPRCLMRSVFSSFQAIGWNFSRLRQDGYCLLASRDKAAVARSLPDLESTSERAHLNTTTLTT
jgi:hypothetical protein